MRPFTDTISYIRVYGISSLWCESVADIRLERAAAAMHACRAHASESECFTSIFLASLPTSRVRAPHRTKRSMRAFLACNYAQQSNESIMDHKTFIWIAINKRHALNTRFDSNREQWAIAWRARVCAGRRHSGLSSLILRLRVCALSFIAVHTQRARIRIKCGSRNTPTHSVPISLTTTILCRYERQYWTRHPVEGYCVPMCPSNYRIFRMALLLHHLRHLLRAIFVLIHIILSFVYNTSNQLRIYISTQSQIEQ